MKWRYTIPLLIPLCLILGHVVKAQLPIAPFVTQPILASGDPSDLIPLQGGLRYRWVSFDVTTNNVVSNQWLDRIVSEPLTMGATASRPTNSSLGVRFNASEWLTNNQTFSGLGSFNTGTLYMVFTYENPSIFPPLFTAKASPSGAPQIDSSKRFENGGQIMSTALPENAYMDAVLVCTNGKGDLYTNGILSVSQLASAGFPGVNAICGDNAGDRTKGWWLEHGIYSNCLTSVQASNVHYSVCYFYERRGIYIPGFLDTADSFADSANTPLTNHITTLGSYGWSNIAKLPKIVNSGSVTNSDAQGSVSGAVINHVIPSSNYLFSCAVTNAAGATGSHEIALAFRINWPWATNAAWRCCYILTYMPDVSGGAARIYKNVSNTITQITPSDYTGVGQASLTNMTALIWSNNIICWLNKDFRLGSSIMSTNTDPNVENASGGLGGYCGIGSAFRGSRDGFGCIYSNLMIWKQPPY